MIIVGAHYLPFTFLYGMRLFVLLAAALIFGGLVLAMWIPLPFSSGGLGATTLVVFAFLLRSSAARTLRQSSGPRTMHRQEEPARGTRDRA